MIWSLVWRNVWRNKRRSAVILIAIAFGLWAGLLSAALTFGMTEQMIASAIDVRTSHIQIHQRDFRTHKELGKVIPLGINVMDQTRRTPDVKAVSARAVVTGMASSPASGTGVVIMGIDPRNEQQVSGLSAKLIEGDYFEGATRNPIVIGKKLADKLNVNVGNKIVLTAQVMDGSLSGGAFRIVGIFKTVSSQYDLATVFTLRNDLDAAFELGGAIHEIAVMATDARQVDALEARLKTEFPDLDVAAWNELEPELGAMNGMTQQWILIFMVIILMALVFGITNTMLMGVLERVREFGVVMALGMNRRRIFGMIVLETIVLSGIGGCIGMIAGAATIAVLARTGIDLSIVQAGMEAFGMSAVLYPSLPFSEYPLIAALVVFSALAAAVYPGIKAVRLNPVNAIRTY